MVVRESEYVSGTVITYEAAFDHSDAGVGLCLQLPKALVLQKFVDMSLDKNISVHFVFTCPNNTSEFEALHGYITCSMIKFYTSGSCKILVSHFVPTVARRNTYACQVEPNAEHCQVPWTQSDKALEYVFPRTVGERCHTVSELQNLSVVNRIDFRRPNGCDRTSDQIDVTSLTVQSLTTALLTSNSLRKVYSQPLMVPSPST